MITDFETWMLDVGMDRTFQMLEYRRPGDWTPRELESKYIDQSQYVDDRYTYIKIKEAIELPDGDILIGYIDVTDSEWVLEPGGINHSESSRNNQSELIRNSQCTCLAN